MLAENESRWEGLTEADRERLRVAAQAIASRLLHEPTLRLKRDADDDDSYAKVAVLRELFGLDPDSEPLEASGAEVSDLRERRRRPRQVSRLRLGTRGSALALVQAEAVAAALGGAEVVDDQDRRRRGRRQGALRRAGSSARSSTARSSSASTRPRTCPASCPTGWRWSACPAARTRATRSSAPPARSTELAEGARVGTSSLRRRSQLLALRPDLEIAELRGNVDTRLAQLAAGDYDGIVLATAGLARLGRADEIALSLRARPADPGPGPGLPGARGAARRRRGRARRPRPDHRPRGADRADRRARGGARARGELRHAGRRLRALRGRASSSCSATPGSPDGDAVGPRPGRGRPRAAGRARRGARRADAGRGRRGDPRRAAESGAMSARAGVVYLVGAGPGDPG